MILGVTGKIGSGKHTVAKMLEEQGFFLIDSDKLAHDLYLRGSDLWHKLVDTFGKRIIDHNYEIDRIKLGKIVFADSEKLHLLNEIIHPELKQLIKSEIAKANIQNKENIVVVAALAEKLDLINLVNQVVLVTASIDKRLQWLEKSRNLSEKEILKRNDAQDEIKQFDLEIRNDGNLEDLKEKILQLF